MTEKFDLSDHHEQIFGTGLTEEQMPSHTHCECREYECTSLNDGSIRVRLETLEVSKQGKLEDCPLPATRRWSTSIPITRSLFTGQTPETPVETPVGQLLRIDRYWELDGFHEAITEEEILEIVERERKKDV